MKRERERESNINDKGGIINIFTVVSIGALLITVET